MQEGENRRLSFLFAPAAGRGTLPPSADGESPAEVQRKTLRPVRANPPAAVRVPRSAGTEKAPPVRGEPACGSSSTPLSRCRKGAAPSGRTRLRQFVCPGQPVQESTEFHRDKIFQENMRYPLAKYAKIGYYIQALFCMNSRMMLNDVKNTIIWRHSDYDRR